MPYFVGGGSAVGSAEITDGAIVDEDINAAAAIALTKLSGLIGNPGSFLSVETSTSTTYSLTTVANQRVVVFAKFWLSGGAGETNATLAYNGVTKDTTDAMNSTASESNMLMYTEVPGAATANITLTAGAGSFNAVKIIVFKVQESA